MAETLSTGYIIAGAYAQKLRKTLFARLSSLMKSGEIQSQEVARAAGEVNRLVFEILVNELKLDKGDLVRIRIDYEVKDGKIEWNWNTLQIEAFKRMPEEQINEIIKKVLEKGVGMPEYSVEKIGETRFGDIVYKVLENEREVGKILVSKINDEILVKGATKEPNRIIESFKIKLSGTIEDTIKSNITTIVQTGNPSDEESVKKALEDIEELLK